MRLRAMLSLVFTSSLVFGLLNTVDVAMAATITVNSTADENPAGASNGNCTLREAIDAANSNAAEDACPAGTAGSDTIVLPSGTYGLTVPGTGEQAGATGDLDINEDLVIEGAGERSTIIDANDIDRVVDVGPSNSAITVRLAGLTITDGSAGNGGGIMNVASLHLDRVVVSDNESGGDGAGMWLGGTLTAVDSLFVGNHSAAGGGGAMSSTGGTVTSTFTNVTVSGNSSGGGGGFAVFGGGTLSLNNTTITQNQAVDGDGGGIWNATGTLNIRNSIVAGNVDPTSAPDCTGTITSQGHNVIGTDEGCTFTATTGDQVGTSAAPIDPRLGPLANNGGPTDTHAIAQGSPAKDAGDPANPGTGGTACGRDDQRGAPRKNCDVGAYELVKCLGTIVNRVGTPGADLLVGTGGKDGMLGLNGDDTLRGKGKRDKICAGRGRDTAAGGGGNDKIRGDAGGDLLRGGPGNDKLAGNAGKDTCVGGGGKRDKGVSCKVERGIP